MLAQLKMIVDVIRDAVSGFESFHSKRARTKDILELLCIYFVLLDVVTEGRDLLEEVGNNPKSTIENIPYEDRAAVLSDWDSAICRQGSRLYMLSGRLLGQDALAVFDPKLKQRLEKIVGSKFQRVRTLHGIGAGLVIHSMFGDPKDQKASRALVLSMYPTKSRATIDSKAANRELSQLAATLEEFRAVCAKLATTDEILAISKKARRMTKISTGKNSEQQSQAQISPSSRLR
jgi:hypothetical protein